LDDSAIRRITLPEAFLSADVILSTLINIADGLHVRNVVNVVLLSIYVVLEAPICYSVMPYFE